MKLGMRKVTLSKSIGMGFQGQMTRGFWRSIDKSYGKKYLGTIKHPKKSIYNSVYSKVTFGGISGFKKGDGVIGLTIRCLYKIGILK